METMVSKTNNVMEEIRHEGKWYTIKAKQYEPEGQKVQVAWKQIKEKMSPEESYRKYFETQRENAKILYPSFRKDVD